MNSVLSSCLLILAGYFVSLTASANPFLPDTIDKIKPAIVGVGTFMPTRRPQAELLGTGFVVADGRIVTNKHVVSKDLNSAKMERWVVFAGAGRNPAVLPAIISDSDAEHDIALLMVSKKLPGLSLAANHPVREGEAYAFTGFPIGAVLGLYPVTHTASISSITPVAIPAPSSRQLDARKISRLRRPFFVYQLDSIAYPGNSGSPLYNPKTGEVVGVINMVHIKATKEDVLSKPSAISYAIPIKYVVELLEK